MITPLRNRVLVRPLVDKQSGAIEIPDEFKQSQTVEVVSIGTDVKLPIEVGQRILTHPNAAWTNVEIDGEPMRVINTEFLLAVMEEA